MERTNVVTCIFLHSTVKKANRSSTFDEIASDEIASDSSDGRVAKFKAGLAVQKDQGSPEAY